MLVIRKKGFTCQLLHEAQRIREVGISKNMLFILLLLL